MVRVTKLRGIGLLLAGYCAPLLCHAQGLAPRAYVIVPVHSNAVTLTYVWQSGDISLDGAFPITDARGTSNISILSYYTAFGLFGRFANFTVSLPYSVANYSGNVAGEQAAIYRSGLMDSNYRFSVNLKGGPAMEVPEFRSWRQKTLIGASVMVVAPTGQHDPARLINNSSHRWSFRPEIGFSQRWRRLILDAYGAVWWFTANRQDYPTHLVLTQQPIGTVETHLSFDVKPRLWFSVDGNFWAGGAIGRNGGENPQTRQQSSRLGVTASIPLSRHQSMKFSYSDGAYYTFGGNYQNLSIAWQYSWITQPR
jgi:hypothetical protein